MTQQTPPPPDAHRFTLWQVITACAIVASAVAPAAWYVARARVDDELRQYEKSKDWQLPELLKNLGVISKRLEMQLRERAELEHLRKRVPQLESEAAQAKQSLEKLSQYELDTFDLTLNEARVLVPGRLTLGLKDVGANGDVVVNFNGRPATMTIGTSVSAQLSDSNYNVTEYRVTLLSVSFRSGLCKFKFDTVALPVTTT